MLKNYQGQAEILIVGDCPPWYDGPIIKRKRDCRGSGFRKGLSDVLSKMEFISNSDKIRGTFVWMMDDVFMVKPTSYDELAKPRAGGFIRKRGGNGWQTVKANTADQLSKSGYTTYDYATHLPHFVEKPLLQDLFKRVDRRKCFFLWEVMYWNLMRIKPEKHVPFLRRLRRSDYDYDEIARKANFINLAGNSWSKNMRDWLCDRFPEFTDFESGIIQPKGRS